jgi:hypothetical protein
MRILFSEFIVSTNRIDRTERHSVRCLFIRFQKWDHLVSEEKRNEMARSYNAIIGEKKDTPIDYVASFINYIYSEKYKDRLNHNAAIVARALECKGRTSRSYALAMNFVDLLFDEFPNEMRSLNMTLPEFEE